MKQRIYKDLTKLAHQRTREAVMSVAQLMDDDRERAALLLSVAADFIKGAAQFILDGEHCSKDDAYASAVRLILDTLGSKVITAALAKTEEEMYG